MNTPNDNINEKDIITDYLSTLHFHDIDYWRAERFRRDTIQLFQQAHRRANTSWFRNLRNCYQHILEPAFITGVSILYLGWAICTVAKLLGLYS